jgi:hypothetical protein
MSRIHGIACGLLAVALACATPAASAGELAWERTRIDAAAKPGQRVVNFEFRFENKGNGPVVMLSAEASCRCVAVNVPLKAYGPGERGVLRAAFSVGIDRGAREQSITVTTNEAKAKPVELILRVTVSGAGD